MESNMEITNPYEEGTAEYTHFMEFVIAKMDEADTEYAKYNGFASQVSETRREEKLNGAEMDIMSMYTTQQAKFWHDIWDSINEAKKK